MTVVKRRITQDDGHLFEGNVNPWLQDIKGIKFSRRIWVSFANINTDKLLNKARNAGEDGKNLEVIRVAFSVGYDTTMPLPCLYELSQVSVDKDGNIHKFGIITGNHRITVLRDLGYEGFWFDIYDLGLDGVSFSACLLIASQRTQSLYPGLEPSINDLLSTTVDIVKRGDCPNTKEDIRKLVKVLAPTAHPTKIGQIVNKALPLTKPPTSFYNWTSQESGAVRKTLRNRFGVFTHGSWDRKLGKLGHTMSLGYSMQIIYGILKEFHNNGKEAYIVGHAKNPDSEGSLISTRLNILRELQLYEDMMLTSFEYYKETGKFPWEFIGFLPQDTTKELDAINNGKMLHYTMDELVELQRIEQNSLLSNSIGVDYDECEYDEEEQEAA